MVVLAVADGILPQEPAIRPQLRDAKKKCAQGEASEREREWFEREQRRRERIREELTRKLIEHERAKRDALRGRPGGDGSELFGDWSLHHPRAAWMLYQFMDVTDWKHLPGGGGWLDQDESLMTDITILARMASYVRAQLEVNEATCDG